MTLRDADENVSGARQTSFGERTFFSAALSHRIRRRLSPSRRRDVRAGQRETTMKATIKSLSLIDLLLIWLGLFDDPRLSNSNDHANESG